MGVVLAVIFLWADTLVAKPGSTAGPAAMTSAGAATAVAASC